MTANNYIPIIEGNPDKSYTVSGYAGVAKPTTEQYILMRKSIAKNLEAQHFQDLEEEDRRLSPKLTERQWLEIFPEAKKLYILPKIRELKKYEKPLREIIAKCLKIIERVKPENKWFWQEYIKVFYIWDLVEAKRKLSRFKHLIEVPKKIDGLRSSITDRTIEEAKSQLIENIINQNIQLKKIGNKLIGCCPLHSERTPSFYIYLDTNSFYCFGCQEGGDVIKFVQKYYNISFREAIKFLSK